jgi:hypothetical protein
MATVGRRFTALALLQLLFAMPAVAEAQAVKAGVVTTAEGLVTARRIVLPQPVPLKFKDDVFLQDTITTGDRSLARLLLSGRAVVTVRERSVLTITEVPGRSTVEIESGKIGMAVARDRMRPGEAIDILTPNAIVAVRGTVLVVEVRRTTARAGGGAGAAATDVYLLRDSAEVVALDPQTRAPMGPPLRLLPMQRFTVVGGAPPQVTGFTAADEAQIAEGLQPRSVPHYEAANPEQVKGLLLGTTAALLAAVTGTGPERLALAPTEASTPSAPQPVETTPTAPPIIPNIQSALEESAGPTPSPGPGGQPTPPPPSGSEISLTGDVTIPAGQTLRSFSGEFTRTDPAPLIQATGARLTQLGPDDLIEVLAGAHVTLASPLFDVRDSEVRAGRSLLRVDGFLTGTSPDGLVTVDPSTLTSSGDLIRVNPGGLITTAGPLLSAVDTHLSTAPGQLLHVVGGDPELTTPGIVVSSGTLLSFIGSQLDLTNNLVRLFDGGIIVASSVLSDSETSSAAPPLVVFRGSTYAGGQGPGTVTGGSLLRMFSQTDRDGSVLLLAGPYLSTVDTRFESREAPLFNIADGSVILSTSSQPFASFERSLVTSASHFFSLDTNTQFGPPPGAPPRTPPTVGSGAPASVVLAGPLIRAVDTTFTVNGSFLGLHNEVTLDQTGPVPLIVLEGSTPGTLSVTAARNFFGLTADRGHPAPSLALGGVFESEGFGPIGGTLLSARNATLANGDPTVNNFSFLFIGDGAEVIAQGPAPLFTFVNSSVDTAGNLLTLRRSRESPSTLQLAGPLLMAEGSTFNTTSMRPAGACCSGFFVGEGARLTSLTSEPLIRLTESTFNAGPDVQSGGTFFSVSTSGGFQDATPAPGLMSLTGGLLLAERSGISSLFNTLSVTGSQLVSSSRDPLIRGVNSWIRAGGTDPFTQSVTLGRLLLVSGATVGPARVELWGPAISVSVARDVAGTRDAWLSTTGGLIAVLPAFGEETQTLAELVVRSENEETPAPLARVTGGAHVLGTVPGTTILDFRGRASAPTVSEEVEGTTVTWGTDQPIQTVRTLLVTDGATISGQKLARFDRMLFEATAPIFQGREGSRTTLNGPNAIELSYQTKVTSLGPMLVLDGSTLSVQNGALIFANGSFLDVAGDLLSLSNGSRLNLSNGAVLNVTGNSVARIGGALVAFGGSGNQVNVTNGACLSGQCLTFGEVRVALTGGATGANVSIGGNVIKGSGGVINYSSPQAAAIVVNGSGSRVVIRGQ